MKMIISPSSLSGTAKAPPSKSMAHRLLIAAGLSAGESIVRGVSLSQDILATMDCLNALGAKTAFKDGSVLVRGTDLEGENDRASGTDLKKCGQLFSGAEQQDGGVLPCRESGSTLRFFTPLCLLSGKEHVLYGSRTLFGRPLTVYEEICREQGLHFSLERDESCGSLTVKGPLRPGAYRAAGNVSSQFITGLLFALPLLFGDSTLTLLPPVESGPYIDMTLSTLRMAGVMVERRSETEFFIPGGQHYRSGDFQVEGDWSNAAVFLAAGLPVTGLDPCSLQGDKVCEKYFRLLDRPLKDQPVLSLSDCPDLGPVLFAYAALKNGGHFTGTGRLRLKESDRGEAMREELRKFGVDVWNGENEIVVGCGVRAPSEELDSHNDHRIVMALTLLSAAAGGVIRGAEAVNKSFPDFFLQMRTLGLQAEEA